MSKSVAILGGGPVAAFTARACLDNGIAPEVFTKEVSTGSSGAFWFYGVPEAVSREVQYTEVIVRYLGQADVYAKKVYGRAVPCSFPDFNGRSIRAYDPKLVLPLLWKGIPGVKFVPMTFESDGGIESVASGYDLVFQTFPTFAALATEPRRKMFKVLEWPGTAGSGENYVLYNGLTSRVPMEDWYRHSVLFGNTYLECSAAYRDPSGAKATIQFKLDPSSFPWYAAPAKNIVLIGRYATWQKNMLAHEAYQQAFSVISGMGS
jgi:hypothetical protein